MTNEEAIAIIEKEFSECKDTLSVYAEKRKKAFDMAIKALEQTELNPSYNSVKSELEQTRWIPCSEKLPEDDKKVLVYVKRKDDEKSEMNGFHIARKHYMEGDSEGKSNFWGIPIAPCEWRIEGWSYFFEPEVLAWMPLPQPYAESEDKE